MYMYICVCIYIYIHIRSSYQGPRGWTINCRPHMAQGALGKLASAVQLFLVPAAEDLGVLIGGPILDGTQT